MNIYKILVMNYGNTMSHVVQAFDPVQAIQNSGINASEIIKVELIGSANEAQS